MPIRLGRGPTVTVDGLLDTGAATSVLPWSVGVSLGLDWAALAYPLALSGNLSSVVAKVAVVTAQVGTYPPVPLVFAWARTDAVPVLLGQANFFLEFDVCFYRSAGEFEVRPRGTP
jgi:hypothetical protein